MLPLHGQGTAAIKNFIGQEVPLICYQVAMFLIYSRDMFLPSSFNKFVFNLFLLFIYIYELIFCNTSLYSLLIYYFNFYIFLSMLSMLNYL